MNPRGKVPVYTDDDVILYESNAIMLYLDEFYPGTTWIFFNQFYR
jgi:glutathione S-transferase